MVLNSFVHIMKAFPAVSEFTLFRADVMSRPFRSLAFGAMSVVLAILPAGCGRKPAGPPPGMGGPMGPLEVGVLTLAPQPVTLTQELPGRTSAFRVAEIRARVDGIVLKRLFDEGSEVHEGQVLYEIDPAPYQVALDSAVGALARANATLDAARIRENRFRKLIETTAASRQDLDDAIAASKVADAEVLTAEAAVQAARIDLGYTRVISPVTGRAGLSQVTEGAYVQAATATLLATVQQLDPVYVNVTQSTNDVLRLRKAMASGELHTDQDGQATVKLRLDDGSWYAEEGKLQFADVTVNPTTSSVTLRAIFANPQEMLLPGMFVRAQLMEGTKPDALLLPQQVVSRNTRGEPTTLVVDGDDKVELRVLETTRTVGGHWLVTGGVKAGDRIIMDNLQKVRPGAPVKPVPWQSPAGAAATGPSATAAR